MYPTFIQRMWTQRRSGTRARHRSDYLRPRDNDPRAFARGLMNAFVLSLLIWILVALTLTWLTRG